MTDAEFIRKHLIKAENNYYRAMKRKGVTAEELDDHMEIIKHWHSILRKIGAEHGT